MYRRPILRLFPNHFRTHVDLNWRFIFGPPFSVIVFVGSETSLRLPWICNCSYSTRILLEDLNHVETSMHFLQKTRVISPRTNIKFLTAISSDLRTVSNLGCSDAFLNIILLDIAICFDSFSHHFDDRSIRCSTDYSFNAS